MRSVRVLRRERVLRRRVHDVFGDVRHQQANDNQHHADGSAHRRHGDNDVLHPAGREAELHAGVVPFEGVGPHAQPVGHVRVQLVK